MAKGGRALKNDTKPPKIRKKDSTFAEEDMDDEIDAFHKQRDIVPLDVGEDSGSGSSDEDDVLPVYDIEGLDDDEDEDDEEDEDDDEDHGYGAKIAKQLKIMRRKTGGAEDETHDDSEEERETFLTFGKRKEDLYGADNVDFEIQSNDEMDPIEEEEEAIRLRKEMAKSYSMEDFMPEDNDEEESDSGGEKTLEDILPKTRGKSKPKKDKGGEDDTDTAYEVKKDLNALSREEQMEVVYSSAPELVGLLSELKDALDHLESKVNPLVNKVKKRNDSSKEVIHYLETKQCLLLAYCQAISFYLLLKSEGHMVRDHPVIARLVDIKTLLDKMKQLDNILPLEKEEIFNRDHDTELGANLIQKGVMLTSEPVSIYKGHSPVSVRTSEEALPRQPSELMKDGFSERNGNIQEKRKREVGLQSKEMLRVRESLEEKLKQKGVFSSISSTLDKTHNFPSKPVTRHLETFDDFGDEVIDKERDTNLSNGLRSTKLSKLVATKLNKSKVVSGDDDLPMRDDIGERRRKHEIRVLATAGIESNGELKDAAETPRDVADESLDDGDEEDSEAEVSEDEIYEQAKRRRIAKLSAKAELYSRTPVAPLMEEPDLVDGKRQITRQIEKNRGLTRARKKLIKNPRKKYKLKHQKAVIRRKGQVRDIKKPTGPYGGETSGINAGISRSVRFKN